MQIKRNGGTWIKNGSRKLYRMINFESVPFIAIKICP